MNRDKYERATIMMFDIIGTYFVDQFYNNHYLIAINNVRTGSARSVTEAYRTIVVNYANGISRPEWRKVAITRLHKYYQSMQNNSIAFIDFEDRLLREFVPTEYYTHYTSQQKDSMMSTIISRAVRDMCELVLSSDMLRRIVDFHGDRNNIIHLQDAMIDTLIIQREECYEQFHKEASKDRKDYVNRATLDKLKSAYVEEKRTSCTLKEDRERALNMIQQLTAKIVNLERELANLREELRSRPADVRPADVRPADVRPADVRPADVRPADVRPADVRPADVRTGITRPADVRPVVTPEKSVTSILGEPITNPAWEWAPIVAPESEHDASSDDTDDLIAQQEAAFMNDWTARHAE